MDIIWKKVKESKPSTPHEFVHVLRSHIPRLDVSAVIHWQRAMKTKAWEREICDFLYFYLLLERGDDRWASHVKASWPNIQAIIGEQALTDAFAVWSL